MSFPSLCGTSHVVPSSIDLEKEVLFSETERLFSYRN